mgnify:CR=1 FL=1
MMQAQLLVQKKEVMCASVTHVGGGCKYYIENYVKLSVAGVNVDLRTWW